MPGKRERRKQIDKISLPCRQVNPKGASCFPHLDVSARSDIAASCLRGPAEEPVTSLQPAAGASKKATINVRSKDSEPKSRGKEKGGSRAQKPPSTVAADAKPRTKALDFEKYSSSRPKRLNDIAQAPPVLKHLPRGARANASSGGKAAGKADSVVSAAQKRMMELEREKAITRYRALRESKFKQGGLVGST